MTVFMRWFETCHHDLECVCVWHWRVRNQVFPRQETENKAPGCINKEDLRVLKLHVNVLMPLESHGCSVYAKKGPSQGKVHLFWRHEPLLSAKEPITAGYKSSGFHISIDLSLVLVKDRIILKSEGN